MIPGQWRAPIQQTWLPILPQQFIPAIQQRPGVRKVCLLLTDGAPWRNDTKPSVMRTNTVAAADAMKEAGVTIVGVGIAIEEQPDSDFLEGLASSPALYSSVPSFDELDAYIDVIMEHVCGVCVRWAARARVLAPSPVQEFSIWLRTCYCTGTR
jgi:hypothetical protein